MFSGRALDAGYFKVTFFCGLALQMVGIFTLSVGHEYYQVLLSGIAQGLGSGMTFTPTVALLATYFTKQRSLAIGIAAAGSGVGGIVYPAAVRSLLPQIGYGWTVRVCGFIMLTLGMSAGLGLRTRVPPRKSGPLVELSAFREPPYTFFCIAGFLFFFGIFFPYYYASSFAREVGGVSYSEAASILIMMNAIGLVSRTLPNYFADKYTGPLLMLVPGLFGTAVVTYGWAGVHDRVGVWVWSAFYGLFAAVIQGMFPATMSSLTFEPQKQGTRMGMGFFIASCGAVAGSPLGGALIQARDGSYLYAQMWAGSSILAGGIFTLFAWLAKRAHEEGRLGWKGLLERKPVAEV